MGGVVGDVIGGSAESKGSKKAAEIAQQTANTEIAAAQSYNNANIARYSNDVSAGDSASALYNDAIGNGTDPNAASTALSTFQGSTGYKTTLANDLAATNASAYNMGLGQSGAAMKALQDRGAADAQQSYQSWLGNLQVPINTGAAGKAALAGSSLNTLNATNTATGTAGTAAENNALAQGAITATTLNNIGSLSTASSYGGGGSSSGIGGLLSSILG